MNSLLGAGETEKAQQVAENVAQLDAATKVQIAGIQSSAQVQTALIDAKARLQQTQMGAINDVFSKLIGENVAQQGQQFQGQTLPYQILAGLSGQTKQTGATPPSGVNLGGLPGMAVSALFPPSAMMPGIVGGVMSGITGADRAPAI